MSKLWKRLLASFIFMAMSNVSLAESMTQQKMESIVKQASDQADGRKGVVKLVYHGVKMGLISDVSHNRMRIISPVKRYEDINLAQRDAIMKANFHSALDARYAVSDGILYSAYIHPISSLTEKELISALAQVANLVVTFGKSYSSGALKFNSKK